MGGGNRSWGRCRLSPLRETEIVQCLINSRNRISATAWLVVREANTAEDIFQNVVLKALTKDVQFYAEAALLSWAFVTARREALDWIERNRRTVPQVNEELLAQMDSEWNNLANGKAAVAKLEALESCLEATAPKSKELLTLRYAEGLSCQLVARRLNLELNTVYKRLSRLHLQLKECIESKLAIQGFDGTAPAVEAARERN